MKKRLCVLSSLLAIILFTSDTSGGERRYSFDHYGGWEAISANWKIINGEYVQTGSSDEEVGIAVLRDSEGVDTRDAESIEVYGKDLRSGDRNNIAIVFGFDERNPKSYRAGIGFGAGAWGFAKFNPRTKQSGGNLARADDANLKIGSWYHLKLVFRGNIVILYGAIKGMELEERLRYTIPGVMPSGKIGLAGNNCDNKYDDFIVRGPRIEQMAVEPLDKLSTTWANIKYQL